MSDLWGVVLGSTIVGIGGGLSLLVQGFSAYRRADRVADTATSGIGTLAVGEVRVTGRVEPAELTLASPLQGRSCVYYRARVREQEGRSRRTVLAEERAVGFRVRDASGSIRVFPRGTSWDVPPQLQDADGLTGELPAGLSFREGPDTQPAAEDREAQVARLLTVQGVRDGAGDGDRGVDAVIAPGDDVLGLMQPLAAGPLAGRRYYEEARIEPGDTVTIIGTALPFDQLPDPDGADSAEGEAVGGPLAAAADPEIAADLDAARSAGTLETDAAAAWGNAAIPGFGIGRPVRPPALDPAARPSAVADGPTAERYRRTFDIQPGELVLAIGHDRPMLISLGPPAVAVARDRDAFRRGLLGAVIAIVAAIVLALLVSGTLGL